MEKKNGRDVLLDRFPAARAIWAVPGPARSELHGFSIGGRVVIIHEYPDGHGWDAYLPAIDGASIVDTLDAITARTDIRQGVRS